MDYEKYYDLKSDGSYVIHFPNNKGLNKNELEELFSVFGKVLSIDDRGQAYGLCFVRYQNLEDVKRCLVGCKDHKHIKILPHKNKSKMTNTKTKQQNNSKYKPKNEPRNNYPQDVPWGNQSDSNLSKLSGKDTNTSNEHAIDNGDFSDSSLSSSVKTANGDNHSIRAAPLLKSLTLKRLQHSTSANPCSSEPRPENSAKSKELFDLSEIPALVCADQTGGADNLKPKSSVVIPAEEIIVANIHPSLSVHYILHLFEKYNPIAVSLMMTIPKSGLRYCHVYYTTTEDASATVEEFDKCLLRGKNLMVLTLQKLMEEACLP